MTESATEHVFNDDLLANPGDLDRVRMQYPDIAPVLDHPEMRALFLSYDVPANAAKSRSRSCGIAAILLIAASLLVTAAGPLIGHLDVTSLLYQSWQWVVVVTAGAAVAGIVIGSMGLLFRGTKDSWLYRRLMTERLRQLHFQTLICRLPEIVEAHAAGDGYAGFRGQRARWLAGFQKRFEGKLGAEFHGLVESDSADRISASDLWLHPPAKAVNVDAINPAVIQTFDAYRALRIKHQLQYANMKLGESHTLLPSLPASQAALFSSISLVSIFALVVIHVTIAAITFSNPETKAETHNSNPTIAAVTPASVETKAETHNSNPTIAAVTPASPETRREAQIPILTWLEVATLWIAIAALFVRALEEGLKPERELERYRHYRSAIHAVSDRFEEAGSPAEKIEVMKEMERLIYDEMCDFMRTHHHARFVM